MSQILHSPEFKKYGKEFLYGEICMSTVRTQHNRENPFAQINRKSLCDENLSLEAVGLWARMISRPSDWEIRISELTKSCKCGKAKLYKIIKELESAGYVYRSQSRKLDNNRNRFGKFDYIFFESKEDNIEFQKSLMLTDFQRAEKQRAENRYAYKEYICTNTKDDKRDTFLEKKKSLESFNLNLSDEERKRLEDEYGKELVESKIAFLEAYDPKKSNSYKSHYKTINAWCLDQRRKDKLKNEKQENPKLEKKITRRELNLKIIYALLEKNKFLAEKKICSIKDNCIELNHIRKSDGKIMNLMIKFSDHGFIDQLENWFRKSEISVSYPSPDEVENTRQK